jgi:hypothetical protein
MKEHEGYNPAEMPRRESEHAAGASAGSALLHEQPGEHVHAGRAQHGQTVWVCVSVIKADRRDEFSSFVREVLAPAARAVRPAEHASVRFLEPATPGADGTWSFVWLMDPALPGETYEVGPIFEDAYGHQKAVEYGKRWDDMHVGDQLFFEAVQTGPEAW